MVEVKICGLKTEPALRTAIEAGADYVGFVFFPRSPRAVDVATAARLAVACPGSRTRSVALLVDADDALIEQVVTRVAPDVLQLHGHETPGRCAAIRARTGKSIWKAASVRTREDIAAAVAAFAKSGAADMILFDAKPADPDNLPGGNGLAFDWHILEGVRGRMPFALAGGLTAANVAAAVQLTGASVVDVSSGVESAPGLKDAGLIRSFIKAAKTANEAA